MTLWQFGEQVDGWIEANTPPGKEGLSEAEEDGLWELVKAPIASRAAQ